MGTTQLLFVFLSFVLFGYFILISNQRDIAFLTADAKYEMFEDMQTIGDYANKYYFKSEGSSNALETMILDWHSSSYYFGTIPLQSGTVYKIKITGLIQFDNGNLLDPGFQNNGGTGWILDDQATYEWRQRYIVGVPPDDPTYNPTHSYEWTVTGAGSELKFLTGRNGQTTNHPTNYQFIVELLPASGGSTTSNSYNGFKTPQYLLNRPYSNIEVQIISDSLIHFIGSTKFEEGITYTRKCTPSGSIQLIN